MGGPSMSAGGPPLMSSGLWLAHAMPSKIHICRRSDHYLGTLVRTYAVVQFNVLLKYYPSSLSPAFCGMQYGCSGAYQPASRGSLPFVSPYFKRGEGEDGRCCVLGPLALSPG